MQQVAVLPWPGSDIGKLFLDPRKWAEPSAWRACALAGQAACADHSGTLTHAFLVPCLPSHHTIHLLAPLLSLLYHFTVLFPSPRLAWHLVHNAFDARSLVLARTFMASHVSQSHRLPSCSLLDPPLGDSPFSPFGVPSPCSPSLLQFDLRALNATPPKWPNRAAEVAEPSHAPWALTRSPSC